MLELSLVANLYKRVGNRVDVLIESTKNFEKDLDHAYSTVAESLYQDLFHHSFETAQNS
jgi:hypothetical protein